MNVASIKYGNETTQYMKWDEAHITYEHILNEEDSYIL